MIPWWDLLYTYPHDDPFWIIPVGLITTSQPIVIYNFLSSNIHYPSLVYNHYAIGLTKKHFSCYHYYNLLYCCCIQHILNYLCYKCMLYQNCCFEALTISWRLPWTGSCVLPFVTCADTDDNNVPTSWFPWR